jgi:hypothetical protein
VERKIDFIVETTDIDYGKKIGKNNGNIGDVVN